MRYGNLCLVFVTVKNVAFLPMQIQTSAFKKNLIDQAQGLFQNNLFAGFSKWKKTNYEFIAPADREYTYQFLWDSSFHAIVLSHFNTSWAKNEIRNLLLGQWSDGFIPHIIFWQGNSTSLPHWAFIESKWSLRPQTTALTQPPVIALAVEAIYQKDNDQAFLKEVLPKLAKYHRWLLDNRDPDQDNLLSIISPNESGMDELPVFQVVAGYKGLNSAKLHYIYRKGDFLNKHYHFNSQVILDKDYFNVEDLLFNVAFIESSRALARLFDQINHKDEANFFYDAARKAEISILEKCWNKEDKIFYTLYSKQEKQAQVKTVESLIPLFLDGIPRQYQEDLIHKHLLNPEEFWRPFPVPSVASDESYYTPREVPFYKGKLIWRGPTWINTNWFIVKGLRKHGYTKIAAEIVLKMTQLIRGSGFREYYNPETGEGYRRENFGWSTLVVDLL